MLDQARVRAVAGTLLEADGFVAEVRAWPTADDPCLTIEVVPGNAACSDCLVPKEVLGKVMARQLELPAEVSVELIYPGEA